MKHVTVSVDDETYRLSQDKAAAAGVSVSALMRVLLERMARSDSQAPQDPIGEFERLKQLQDDVLAEIQARSEVFSAADRLPREALHERR